MLQHALAAQNLLPIWEFALEHGKMGLAPPFEFPSIRTLRMRPKSDSIPTSRIAWDVPPLTDSALNQSRSARKFASSIGAEPPFLSGRSFWIVYENDGGPPFNPGSGSDQGPTAFLGVYISFDNKRTGLTKLGWTVIDMRTPKPTLPAGAVFGSQSKYETPAGPYSGISSIDFTVTVNRTGIVKVDILGAGGIDSTVWGRFVQDMIHTKISNSPLFPWPSSGVKPFAEMGTAILVTPQKVLSDGEVLGIAYEGKIEFDGKVVTGTHRTEAMGEARYVIRTARVNTPLGSLGIDYTPLGAFGRAFARYNDGREEGFAGVEGGFKSSALVKIGRLGIGLTGEITVSTDPALRTDNRAGSEPLLSPLDGGPAGHHGKGQIILKWEF